MNRYISYPVFLIAAVMVMVSSGCSEENPKDYYLNKDNVPLVAYIGIQGSPSASTRAHRMEIDDQWSIDGFETGDEIGIFASGGNFHNNNGPFDNEKLTYDGVRFNGEDDATFSPAHMNGDEVFLYYPYSPNITEEGLTLRVKDEEDPDGPLRCTDLLTSTQITVSGNQNGNDVALFGTIDHTFSELIIMRGAGFDNPPTGDPKYSRITAVLNRPVTNAKITMTLEPSWSCNLSLESDGSMSELEARSWEAWKGGNYGITDEDPDGKEAWYVMVPTIGSVEGKKKNGERLMVDYIELYDNDGYLQRVTTLKLSQGNTKYLDSGWRYPMEITMNELVPTVNPFPIIPWGEDINLTDQRKRGINDITEFSEWVRDYNLYLLNPTETNINNLLKYGDQYADTDNNMSWHFYILSDLDFANYNPLPYYDENGEEILNTDVIIPRLLDILDGESTILMDSKFINHKITNLTKPFIGSLENSVTGTLAPAVQNIDFIDPEIILNDNTRPTGIVANSINGSSVINCNIESGTLFNPNGPAGMIAGTITNGIIRNCVLSGYLICTSVWTGNEDYAKIVGETPVGTCTFENNDASDVTPMN